MRFLQSWSFYPVEMHFCVSSELGCLIQQECIFLVVLYHAVLGVLLFVAPLFRSQ